MKKILLFIILVLLSSVSALALSTSNLGNVNVAGQLNQTNTTYTNIIQGTLSTSNITATTTNTYDLGSASNYWRAVYITNAYLTNLESNLDGTGFNVTADWFVGKLDWTNIQNKFITAVDDSYIYMSTTTATLNETKLNETIEALDTDTQWSITGSYIYNNSGSLDWNETKGNETYIVAADEGNLNVNSSTNWDGETSQADLNVNSSNYWDTLDSPTDITSLGTIGTGVWQGTAINEAFISALNWTQLQNYPTACPSGTFATQLEDSVTCTAPTAADVDAGTFPAGNYVFTDNVSANQFTGNLIGNVTGTADTATTWDSETSQADLNVNSSNYWDGLDSPTDITSLGTIGTGVWQGTAINEAYISALNWTQLQNYPEACLAGQWVTTIGDTLTCEGLPSLTAANIGAGTFPAGNFDFQGNVTLGDNEYQCFGDSGCADGYIYWNGTALIMKVS